MEFYQPALPVTTELYIYIYIYMNINIPWNASDSKCYCNRLCVNVQG
jgi:hypothetical protein